MKKILTLFMLCVSVLCNAQRPVGSWNIQPKLGLNIATMTNDDTAEIRPALTGGVEIEYFATTNLTFSLGALYSQQGCKSKSSGYKGTIKMDYINIPLMVNYYVANSLALKVGIQPGFLINDKVEVNVNGVSAEVGLEESLKAVGYDANLKNVDVSIPIGLSYEFNNIQLDARYNLGLTKTISGVGIDPSKNSVFQFTIGYKLGLKKL